MKREIKKWYVVYCWYTGQDGRTKVTKSHPLDDYSKAMATKVDLASVGRRTEIVEVTPPIKKKNDLTQREMEDATTGWLFDPEAPNKGGPHGVN